jgi:hypothetical protein
MNEFMLKDIINKIRSDKEHLKDRRVLHENYEWLEHFWRKKYNRGDQSIDNFITDKADFYWGTDKIKELTKYFASIECVGSNVKNKFEQNQEIASATMYLRLHCTLFADATPDCNSIPCRHHKTVTGHCSALSGRQWKNVDNNNHAAFKALMYIIRQIRNNLFHGHKMTLDNDQFQRDKILVSIAAQTTGFLIDNLVDSRS